MKMIFNSKFLFWGYFGFIILLVVLPLNSAGELNDVNIVSFRGDYFFHAVVFLPWAFFKVPFRFHAFTWFCLGLLFAAATEGIQFFLSYRAFNINDVIANMAGILIGTFLFLLVSRFWILKR